jgi:hypothetical protein
MLRRLILVVLFAGLIVYALAPKRDDSTASAVSGTATPAAMNATRVAAGGRAACDQSQVEVRLIKFYDKGGAHLYMSVLGEIINHCSIPAGAQIRFVGRDAKGEIAAVRELWPASIRNIPAGGRSPFDLTVFDYDRKIKNVDAEVIEVRQW